VLPAAKVSREIAETRGVPMGRDCLSPSRHSEFGDVDSMLDFVEMLAEETGLPVGIKSAVGDLGFWEELTELMSRGDRGVDFVTIDGGEGGTGASPLIFTDAVSLPFRLGFARVYAEFARRGLHEDVTFIGAGKLGLPDNAVVAFALGADMVNVAREAMLAAGCIQAQRCHTGGCPTGVATQNPWLTRGLDPVVKGERVANYVRTLRRDLLKVAETCGVPHPGLVGPRSVEVLDTLAHGEVLNEVYGYEPGWGFPSAEDRARIAEIMAAIDEEESRTEGPPETAEEGEPSDEMEGDLPASDA
jgi:glutamate synthase (ferredoxin)